MCFIFASMVVTCVKSHSNAIKAIFWKITGALVKFFYGCFEMKIEFFWFEKFFVNNTIFQKLNPRLMQFIIMHYAGILISYGISNLALHYSISIFRSFSNFQEALTEIFCYIVTLLHLQGRGWDSMTESLSSHIFQSLLEK